MTHSCIASRVALIVALVLCGACGSDDGDGGGGLGACAPIEVAIDNVPAVENPFDPAQADVTVTFTGPDASVWSTPGFFSRAYERMLIGGFEHRTATDDGRWYARFTPPRAGAWRWTATVRVPDAASPIMQSGEFSCDPDASSHGVLRRSAVDPRFLVWEDGTPYSAIGENLCWYDGRGTYAYDDWLDKLAAHNANWIRLWMPSWAFGLEWIRRNPDGSIADSTLGNYGNRLDRAWQLDYVIEAARRRGMVVMLAIQNHGAFSLGSNTEWVDNPYNAANGGPLTRPHEVYTNAEARHLFERRLRYLVARWGYAPNLIWEFWNEVDLADAQPDADVLEWHRAMATVLRDLDPYDHLVTTSVALQFGAAGFMPRWLPLWDLPEIDLAQIHLYGIGTLGPVDFTTAVPEITRAISEATGKPVLLGEAGVDFRGPAETLAADPEHRGLHELIWSGVFAGGVGTGMTWWWDNVVDPQDQYGQLDGIWRLTEGIAWDQERFDTDTTAVTLSAPDVELRALPLIGHDTVLVWIRNANHVWFGPDLSPVAGATLRVGLGDGSWHATWVEPHTGATLGEATASANGGSVALDVPEFSGEIAVRLTTGAIGVPGVLALKENETHRGVRRGTQSGSSQ